jgi:hypothetical protein
MNKNRLEKSFPAGSDFGHFSGSNGVSVTFMRNLKLFSSLTARNTL